MFSTMFIHPKKDNTYMLIKSKNLHEHVQYHFKMDTLQSEKELLQDISCSKGSLLLSAH